MVTTFDRLTSSLTATERAELLKRVQGLGALAEDGNGDIAAAEPAAASELELMRLGFLTKLVLILVAFFTGKSRGDVLRDMAMRRLAEQILSLCPGLLDGRRSVFLRKMRDEVESLGQGAGFFRDSLRKAFSEEHDAFVAFLTGHLLPHVQERLVAVLNLEIRAAELGAMELGEIRRRIHEDLETAFEAMPEHERKSVYGEIQAMHRLRGLSTLPYSEILDAFDTDTVPGECSYVKIRKYLPALDAQAQAVRRFPSAAALEGLFLFSHADEIGPEFPVEEKLTEELGGATEALGLIRAAIRRVPFTKLVRLATGNLDYLPRPVGGGEDWFLLFKRYWTARSEETMRELARQRERERMADETRQYLEVHRLPRLGTEGMTGVALEVVREHQLSLELVVGFYHEVFFKLARFFVMLLERARFVKEDNRRELGQTFGFLNNLDERFDLLLGGLRSETELMEDPPEGETRRDRVQKATRLVAGFLDEFALNLKLMTNVLEGILRGSPGNRYDTVFNLDTVGDWQGRMMSEVLEEAYDRFSEGLALLVRIRAA